MLSFFDCISHLFGDRPSFQDLLKVRTILGNVVKIEATFLCDFLYLLLGKYCHPFHQAIIWIASATKVLLGEMCVPVYLQKYRVQAEMIYRIYLPDNAVGILRIFSSSSRASAMG